MPDHASPLPGTSRAAWDVPYLVGMGVGFGAGGWIKTDQAAGILMLAAWQLALVIAYAARNRS